MSISQWSTTASNNASGVTNINWAEGMPPASVNNSARQEMADVATWYRNSAEWIDRNDAISFSSGTKVLLTGQDVTSIYNVGRRIQITDSSTATLYGRITASSTSGSDTAITIAWDSTAVLASGTISDVQIGIIGNSTGTQSLDAANIARANQFGTPTGTILPYASTSSEPTGYLFCNGQGVSRTTYADLFSVISTSFGSTSTSTFAVPDLRGRAIIAMDNLGGTSANVVTSTSADTLGGTLGIESTAQSVTLTGSVSAHTLTVNEMPAHTHTTPEGYDGGGGVSTSGVWGTGNVNVSTTSGSQGGGAAHTHNDTFAVSTTDIITVIQPSMALPYIIKV